MVKTAAKNCKQVGSFLIFEVFFLSSIRVCDSHHSGNVRWGNKEKWLIIKPPKAEELHTVQLGQLGVVMREGLKKSSMQHVTSHLRSLQAIIVLRVDVYSG